MSRFSTRNANNIVLHLSPAHPAPPIPIELRDQITEDVWSSRLTAITHTASRFYKPWFERAWSVIGVIAVIVVPLVAYKLVLSALHFRSNPTTAHVFEARGISFAIMVAIMVLFLVPISIWKYLGHRAVNRMIQQWEKADLAARSGDPRPNWKCKTPGIFRSNIILTISLPPGTAPSVFNVNAYLPSYINGPADPDANHYYPFKAEPGLPRMSVVGNVPLFNDEKRGYPGSEKV